MKTRRSLSAVSVLPRVGVAAAGCCLSVLALGQASPFETGADALVETLITIATPIAILAVMGLGIAALAGRISWAWPLCAMLGIVIVFGAETIVTWIRGMFAV